MSLQSSLWWALLFLPAAFTPLIYLLRRWGAGVWLAALVSLGTAYALLRFPAPGALQLLGLAWNFDTLWAYTMALLFASTAFLFILSWFVSQGWSFYPFAPIILSLLGLGLAATQLNLAALSVEMAALLAVFIVQGGRLGSVRAAQRFLILMSLALPLFLLAVWQNDLYRNSFQDPLFLTRIALLLAGGFGLWIGVAPFHAWVSAIALEAKPGIAAFVFIAFPTTAMAILLKLLAVWPWLIELPYAKTALITAGLFSAIVGGLFAAAQKAYGPLMGYAALFNIGVLLAALGLGSQAGITIVFFVILSRSVALILIASANAFIHLQAGGDAFEQAVGVARRWPVAAAGLLAGGLTLVGTPFTAGFVSQWMLLQSLAEVDARWPVIILLGSLGVATGIIRAVRPMLQKGPPMPPAQQNWGFNALILFLITLCLGGGLFPQIALNEINRLAQLLGLPG